MTRFIEALSLKKGLFPRQMAGTMIKTNLALIIVSAICHQGLKPLAIINRYRTVKAPSGRQTIARQFIAGRPRR